MNARLDYVIREDNRRAAEEGEASRMAIAMEGCEQEWTNKIHEFAMANGFSEYSPGVYLLASEMAKAQLGARQ